MVDNKMQTIRQRIIDFLTEKPVNGIEISRALGIREAEVYEHLPHIARTMVAQGKRLLLDPARCLSCGYEFKKRERYSRPSRCPLCRSKHITRPVYKIR